MITFLPERRRYWRKDLHSRWRYINIDLGYDVGYDGQSRTIVRYWIENVGLRLRTDGHFVCV